MMDTDLRHMTTVLLVVLSSACGQEASTGTMGSGGAVPAVAPNSIPADAPTAGEHAPAPLPSGTASAAPTVPGAPTNLATQAMDGPSGAMSTTPPIAMVESTMPGSAPAAEAEPTAAAMDGAESNAPTVATLFWLDINGSRVYRADESDFSKRETLVARTNTAPDGVAVDVEAGKVYWSNMGSLLGAGGGTLQRANLDGSEVETIVAAGIARTPKQMQIDTRNGHAYWCDREGAKVWRAGLDGASPEVLVSGHGFQQLVGIALDVESRVFYFSDRTGRKILRASFDMPTNETADTRTDIEELFLFERGAMPIDLDLDLEARMLYWTDRDLGTVSRAAMEPPAGEAPASRSDIETLVTGLQDPIGLSLDLKQQKLYYAELGGTVYQAGLDGSNSQRIANSGSATGVAIAHLPK